MLQTGREPRRTPAVFLNNGQQHNKLNERTKTVKKLLVMIGAAAMLPIASSAAWSEGTNTFTTNGVEWTFHVDMEAHTALIGKLATYSTGSASGATAIPTGTSGLLQVPEWVECEGVRCNVIGLAYAALMNATKLTGLFWPSTTFGTQIGRAAMPRASSQLRAGWICGPRTVDSGEIAVCELCFLARM